MSPCRPPRPSLYLFGMSLVLALTCAGRAQADDLDKISGTEGWRDSGQLHPKTEWQDWYKARVAWRKARQELRLERARNLHLARLLRRGKPRISDVRRIIRSRLRRRSVPTRVYRRKIRTDRPSPDEDEDRDALESRDAPRKKREPAYRVKPERLDKQGQAIDDEGDSVLKGTYKKKKRTRRRRR